MRRARRDAERNVPPGIPVFSSDRFASGSPPLQGSRMVTRPPPPPPTFSPLTVAAELVSWRAYRLQSEKARLASSASGSIRDTDIYW
jgi:hypothetical protein